MDIYPKGYNGFDSFPKNAVEMPPTYVLLIGLGFVSLAACAWVCSLSHPHSYANIQTRMHIDLHEI